MARECHWMKQNQMKWNLKYVFVSCAVRCALPKKPGKHWMWLNVVYSVHFDTHGMADYRL